jgi:chaperonin GroES
MTDGAETGPCCFVSVPSVVTGLTTVAADIWFTLAMLSRFQLKNLDTIKKEDKGNYMSKLKLRCVRNMVAGELIPPEVRSPGGLFIPETGRRHEFKVVRVLAVGPGKVNDRGEFIPPEVKVDDVIILPPNAGLEIEYDREKVFFCDADESLAIVNRNKEELDA